MGILLKIARARFFTASVLFFALVFLPLPSVAQWNALNPVQSSQKDADGLTIFLERGALHFQVCTDSMVRVLYSPQREFPRVAEYVVIKSDWPKTPFDVNEAADNIALTTARLKSSSQKKTVRSFSMTVPAKNWQPKTTAP